MTRKKTNKRKSPLHKYAQFTGMAFQMGTTIALFTMLGVWLDEKKPNKYSAYTIICSLFGVFASLYLVIRQVQRMNKN